MDEFLKAMKEEVEETRAARVMFRKGTKQAEEEYKVIYELYRAKLGKSVNKNADFLKSSPKNESQADQTAINKEGGDILLTSTKDAV